MTRLEDPRLLEKIRLALLEASNGVSGYVSWKRVAWEWVAKNLSGETQKSMALRLYEYVENGGKVDQVLERRGFDDRYHYDFRVRIGESDIYVESTLSETKTGPVVSIVSVHLK